MFGIKAMRAELLQLQVDNQRLKEKVASLEGSRNGLDDRFRLHMEKIDATDRRVASLEDRFGKYDTTVTEVLSLMRTASTLGVKFGDRG